MKELVIPQGWPLPGMVTAVADDDAMFDGRSDHYLSVALSALHAIDGVVAEHGQPGRILDLPCGHGRATRVLRARFPEAALTVCDINPGQLRVALVGFSKGLAKEA